MLVSLGEMFTALRGWLVTAKDWSTLQFARAMQSREVLGWILYVAWVGSGIAISKTADDRPWWQLLLLLVLVMALVLIGSFAKNLSERVIERRAAERAEKIRTEIELTRDAYRDANRTLSRDVEEMQNRLNLAYTQLDEALRINHNHVTQALQRARTGTAPTAAASLTTEGEQA